MNPIKVGAHRGAASPAIAEPRAQQDCAPTAPSRLWLWVVAAFALQVAAWTAWFIIAENNKVQEVPLATKGER